MAVTVKENVHPEDPNLVLEEPAPRHQTDEDNTPEAARETKDRLARDKILLENEETRKRGPKVGHHAYYHEVRKRLIARLFLALGTERKNRFVQKNPNEEITKLDSKLEFRTNDISFLTNLKKQEKL